MVRHSGEALKRQNTMIFYPQRKGKSKWEKHRDAWCQMAVLMMKTGRARL
jgi:hypothetical protein